MAKYATMMNVPPRMEKRFSKDEIELAAKVLFYLHPPDDCTIPDQELDVSWAEEYPTGLKMIRVAGDVISNN